MYLNHNKFKIINFKQAYAYQTGHEQLKVKLCWINDVPIFLY